MGEVSCPGCQAPMVRHVLDGHLGRSVEVDLCLGCQVFWFDARASLTLSPGAVLKLFRLIGEQQQPAQAPAAHVPTCPRCGSRLRLIHDQQRNTKFEYLGCPKDHGRLTTFVNFLREKDFIRQLSTQQVAQLREHVRTVHCSNCGAPIDLAKASACPHCGSALSMLDMTQAGALVASLIEADHSARPLRPCRCSLNVPAAKWRRPSAPSNTGPGGSTTSRRLGWWAPASPPLPVG